jgi:hypothetical protein
MGEVPTWRPPAKRRKRKKEKNTDHVVGFGAHVANRSVTARRNIERFDV